MSKSEIFIALIKGCQRKDGSFSPFKQHCIKDPKSYFEKKNLLDKYNSLNDEEKEIFKDEEKFFNLCVYHNFKKEGYINNNNKCVICGDQTEFKNFKTGYAMCCSKKCANILREQTNLEKYGVKNISQLDETKIKKEESCLKKYNCKNPTQSSEVKEKAKQTSLEKYGVEYPSQSNTVKEKVKQTSLEKYGVEHYNNREKAKQTSLEKYDVEYPSQSNTVKEKVKQTSLERYGVEYKKQSHIKHIDQFNDLDFIIVNFSNDKRILNRRKIIEYFNISATTYQTKILKPLKSLGYKSSTKFGRKEGVFIEYVEKTHNIILIKQHKIPGTRYKVDGYNPETNTVYEFLGDYWHGNPDVFDENEMNNYCKETFKELYKKTFRRFKKIKSLGYTIIYIWENDWDKTGLDEIKEF